MVKKLIEGFLKRKDDGKKEEAEPGGVPDELPPLGEESQPASPAASDAQEPPEELPSLEEVKPETAEVRPQVVMREEVSVRRAPVAEEESAPEEPSEPAREPAKEQPAAPADGFFSNISKMLREGRSVDSLISHDLLANMKESWNIRKESSKTGLSSMEEKRVGNAITETLTQLRLMESKWRAHKMILDEYEKLAVEQEAKIREKEKELKSLLKAFKIYQHVPDDKILMFKDSIPIRSVSDIINALRTMDNPTFNTYVNSRRNEFSRLAALVDSRLGADLKKAATRVEMLKILEGFVKKLSE